MPHPLRAPTVHLCNCPLCTDTFMIGPSNMKHVQLAPVSLLVLSGSVGCEWPRHHRDHDIHNLVAWGRSASGAF